MVETENGENSSSPKSTGSSDKNLLDMSESGDLAGNHEATDDASSPATILAVPPPKTSKNPEERIRELEQQLTASKAMVESLSSSTQNKNKQESDNEEMMMLLQEKLQSEMAQKAETEHALKKAQRLISDLQTLGQEQTSEFERYRGLEVGLKEAIGSKGEAENDLRMALERIQTLEEERSEAQDRADKCQAEIVSNREAIAAQDLELQKIREQRDEQERKEMSLTNRLNAAKKKEAEKVNAAEKFKDELITANHELQQLKTEVDDLRKTKVRLQKELEDTIVSSRQRQVQVESALADERRLNEDRKIKMKMFVEKKSEELVQAKADNDALQVELNHTTRSLGDLNARWKQLHAQWVQSQTRNRELQRDLQRIKKDSEKQHKVGDTLEMKLSSSAKETEEHKNKRLAAKNELMTVLHTLEAEREVAARLRDSMKFTFTPKALSQQQLLNESVQDFETQLVKLSIRLRRTLPPAASDEIDGTNNGEEEDVNDDDWVENMDEDGDEATRTDSDTHRLIEKLNRETQQVSKCIMAIVGGIERLHLLLDADADRTCYSVLNEILSAGGVVNPETSGGYEERTSMTRGREPRLHSISNQDYN